MLDFLRILLIPFVPIYALLVNLRNFCFDKKIFKSQKVNAKVISIGNLTIGGSGKTPLVIYLTKLLKNNDIKVGVLSRGYRRNTKGFILVSKNGELNIKVEKCGDEIYQTVDECKVPAAVCEHRVEGANKLLSQIKLDSIVLDDAFQHRWIYRDLNILIFEQRFLTSSNKLRRLLLPTGNLREPFSSTKRADLIIINRKFSSKENLAEKHLKFFNGKQVFTAYYHSLGFVDVKSKTFYKPEEFFGQKSLVVSGIANPISFLNALEKINIETTNKLVFIDHKFYSNDNIQNIRKQFYDTNAQSVITTQKDAVKLSQFSKELDDIDIYYLKIELKFDKEEEFNKLILSKLLN